MIRCGFCLEDGHDKADCRYLAAARTATEHGVIDPMTADDPTDQLALRVHRLRAALRGALADLHAAGLSPSPSTKDLIAEEFIDA